MKLNSGKKILDEIENAIIELKKQKKVAIMPIQPKKPLKPIICDEKPKFFTAVSFLKWIFYGFIFYLPVSFILYFLFKSDNVFISIIVIFIVGILLRCYRYESQYKSYKRDLIKLKNYYKKLDLYNKEMIKYKEEERNYHDLISLNKEIDDKVELLKIEGRKIIFDLSNIYEVSRTRLRLQYISFADEELNVGFVNRSITKKDFLPNPSIDLGMIFLKKQSRSMQDKIYSLLIKVQEIQDSNKSQSQKIEEIKKMLWTNQTIVNKITIGGFLGTLLGLSVFGTGGIGIAAFGGAIGVWGFLVGTTGGVLVSSLIANFEKQK